MFETADSLATFNSLRTRYLFVVLPETFTNVPDFSITDSTPEFEALCRELGKFEHAAEVEKDQRFNTIAACDSLLTATDWASTWRSLLKESSTIDGLINAASQRLGIAIPSAVENKKKGEGDTGGGQSKASSASKDSKSEEKTKEEEESNVKKEKGADTDAVDAVDNDEEDTINLSSLKCVNALRLPYMTSLLEASPEAKALGLQVVSASLVRRVEIELERALWPMWTDFASEEENHVLINMSTSTKSEMVMVKYPTSAKLSLPFRGRVTCSPSSNKTPRQFLTKMFGISFFVEPALENICVPAWSVKSTTRQDQAYFEQVVTKIKMAMAWDSKQANCRFEPDDGEPDTGKTVNPDLIDFHIIPFRPGDDSDLYKNRVWLNVSWIWLVVDIPIFFFA